MRYFTLKELTRTSVPFDNNPGAKETENLTYLVDNLLDPVRELWGKPIRVNSGFRSLKVNIEVHGAINSQHIKGEAADITVGSAAENKKLFDLIRSSGFVYDQIIDENDYSWIHISLKKDGVNRKQILHL